MRHCAIHNIMMWSIDRSGEKGNVTRVTHLICGECEEELIHLRAEVVRLKRFSGFGESIWNWVTGLANDFFCFEESEDIMEIAQRHGLAESVAYDPDKHGDLGAERGDKVWYWGKNRTRASEGGEKGRE